MSTASIPVLLVEDNEDDAFLFQRTLSKVGTGEFETKRVELLKEALAAIDEQDFKVALVDLSLPDSHGLNTFLRIHEKAPDLPVVVLTGNADEKVAAEALQKGAQDYLIKGQVVGRGLVRAVHYAIERHKSRALELSNAELMTEVRERTRVQEELQLLASKLRRSNKELQQFASVASHDLQEPLRKIVVFSDRLKAKAGESLNDQAHDYLDRMTNAATRMQTLINDLLAFARVETRGQPFVSVDVGEVAGEVVHDLEVLIEKNGAEVRLENLPTIAADPTQIRQLLQNLIANALKFRDGERTPVVRVHGETVKAKRADETGYPDGARLCRINVEDNGIGFEEKYLDRIFSPFQRLHGRSEYPGSGIGLAVCQRIADRHGGQITATAKPNRGATFIVTLPVDQAERPEEE